MQAREAKGNYRRGGFLGTRNSLICVEGPCADRGYAGGSIGLEDADMPRMTSPLSSAAYAGGRSVSW